jgi:hypothetical protein
LIPIDNRGGFDMATRTTNDTKQSVQKLKGVVDHLISLQGLDRRMNGYLKQRSKGHMFTVISNGTDLALDAIDLAERKRRRVYFSAARRTAVEAYGSVL